MIMNTVYMAGSRLNAVVNYLDKDQGLENRHGEQLDDVDKARFVERGEENEIARMITFSPENGGELSDEELSESTRRAMREYMRGRYSADYLLAIHRDTDHPHTQLALTGNKDDLWMDEEELDELRQLGLDHFPERRVELIQQQLNGREVEDVADEYKTMVQARLPSQSQYAEQSELDESIEMGVGR